MAWAGGDAGCSGLYVAFMCPMAIQLFQGGSPVSRLRLRPLRASPGTPTGEESGPREDQN